MTAEATLLGARLGAGRWRLDVAAADLAGGGIGAVDPTAIVLTPLGPLSPPARVETIGAPRPGGGGSFRLTVAVDAPPSTTAEYRLEIRGRAGWRRTVRLTATDEPAPSATIGAPRTALADVPYTARDFDGLRAAIDAVVAERTGAGAPHVVSQAGALVDLMAYLGDSLAFYQDAVATEAYLSTARRRISACRHATLLDYPVGQAVAARTWVHLSVAPVPGAPAPGAPAAEGAAAGAGTPLVLRAGTPLLADSPVLDVATLTAADLQAALPSGLIVFETLEDVALTPPVPLALDPVAHPDGAVPAGARGLTVVVPGAGAAAGAGLVLLAPEGPAVSGVPVPGAGAVVAAGWQPAGDRLVLSWSAADAPERPILAAGPQAPVRAWIGNLVLADHGCTLPRPGPPAPLPAPGEGEQRYQPVLPWAGIAFSRGGAAAGDAGPAASRLDPEAEPLAAVRLVERAGGVERPWQVVTSLLDSGPVDLDVVVEVESDASANLRFGDGVNGMKPAVGSSFVVSARVGGGAAGNVPALAVRHAAVDEARIVAVRNPVPAVGGSDAESVLSIQLGAPQLQAARQRAVLAADYEEAARAVDGIGDVQFVPLVVGGRRIAVVYVLPVGGVAGGAPAGLVDAVAAALGPLVPLDVTLDVRLGAAYPVTVATVVTSEVGYDTALVASQVTAAVAGAFLQPTSFPLGRAFYESDVISVLYDVKGVVDARCTTFDRAPAERGARAAGGLIAPPPGRAIRIANDPGSPADGSFTYELLTGGRG